MKKVYLLGGGGLGDLIRNYFKHDPKWEFLESLKIAYPDSHVKVILVMHNPQGKEFFKYHPFVDETLWFPWEVDGRPVAYANCDDHVEITTDSDIVALLRIKPRLFLGEPDKTVVDSIASQGKYVVIHPFAGLGDFMPLVIEDYKPIIDALIDRNGLNVVAVGGSYIRTNAASPGAGCMGGNDPKTEEFDYERPGLFNLVGKTNVREILGLIKKARGFLGTFSCYAHGAWVFDVPSMTLIPEKHRLFSLSHDMNCYITRNDFPEHKKEFIAGRWLTSHLVDNICNHFRD